MSDATASLTVIFTEFYYWVTIVFMFLIHVGFCMYEVGASRRKNHMHTLMKNTMVIPTVGNGRMAEGTVRAEIRTFELPRRRRRKNVSSAASVCSKGHKQWVRAW